jgi:hypothetical protein
MSNSDLQPATRDRRRLFWPLQLERPAQLQQPNQGEIMLTTNQTELALRLYENSTYGSTYGKGLFRRALFNGSIDIKSPLVKYVIDLFNYDDWCNIAKTHAQIEIITGVPQQADTLYSWINRYNTSTKQKTLVSGFCSFDCESKDINVMIIDPECNIEGVWKISAKPCQTNKNGLRAPQFLATNADLTEW